MNYQELRLVDDGQMLVQSTLARVLREYEGIDPKYLDIGTIQRELEEAFTWMTAKPTVSVEYDRLCITFA